MENLSIEIEKKLYDVEKHDFVNFGGVTMHEEVETLEKAKELALYEFMNLSNKEKKNFEILVVEIGNTEETEETVVPEYMKIPFVLNEEEIEKKVSKIYKYVTDMIRNYKNNDGTKYNYINSKITDNVKFFFGNEDKIMQYIIIWKTEDLIKEDEAKEVEDIRTELEEEMLNKELTLLELDNTVNGIMCTGSAFDDCVASELLKLTSIGYYYSNNHNIEIEFEIIEKEEEELEDTTLKITNVSIN